MHSENHILIHAQPIQIYRLAAQVERWPRLLPHYRWVRVLGEEDGTRVLEMAARRDRIPVWWCAEQRLYPDEPRVTFTHVRGATTGMQVEWTFDPQPEGVLVTIRHDLHPRMPVFGRLLADRVIGPYFVHYIAGQTLACLKRIAEADPR